MKELVVLIMPGRTAVKTLSGTYPNQIDEMVRVLGYPPYPYPNNHLLSSPSADLGRTSFSENPSKSIGGNCQVLKKEFRLSKFSTPADLSSTTALTEPRRVTMIGPSLP